jgi:hypothetical protein
VSLITHDREFGCRTWSGSYQLAHRPVGWRIVRAPTSSHDHDPADRYH